jgi:hypothetical protein
MRGDILGMAPLAGSGEDRKCGLAICELSAVDAVVETGLMKRINLVNQRCCWNSAIEEDKESEEMEA